MKCVLSCQMKFRDAGTIPPEQLCERHKQAVAPRKKGMSFIEIAKIGGVRRGVVGHWYAMWQGGGMKALKVNQEGIRKNFTEKSPDPIHLPIRTIDHYLQRWNFTPQKPIKRTYEEHGKKANQWPKEIDPAGLNPKKVDSLVL